MRNHASMALAALLALLTALPCAAPFSTCSFADLLDELHHDASDRQGCVPAIGELTVTDDDCPDPGVPHVTRVLASLMASALSHEPGQVPPRAAGATSRRASVPLPHAPLVSSVLRV